MCILKVQYCEDATSCILFVIITIPGEAARKHYFVVDIKGQQWRHVSGPPLTLLQLVCLVL